MQPMNIIGMKKLGYAKAQEIDNDINRLLEEYPVDDPQYRWFWLTFYRTVATSCATIEDVLNRIEDK